MVNRISRPIGLSVLFVVIAAGTAGADTLIANGSFEDPLVTHASNVELFNVMPGWSVDRGESIEILRGLNRSDAADGMQWAGLAGQTLSQDVRVEAGGAYELSFAYAPRPGLPGGKFEILWGGESLDVVRADGRGLSDIDWRQGSCIVTADSDTVLLELDGLGGGVFLDNVALSSLARIPEPASICLLLIGGAALLKRRR